MASKIAVPLVSTVDSSHRKRGHTRLLSDQSQLRSQRSTASRPFTLPRIPSQRLDPRSEDFDQIRDGNGRSRKHGEHHSLSDIHHTSSLSNGSISAPSPYLSKPFKRDGNRINDSHSDRNFRSTVSVLPPSRTHRRESDATKMPLDSWFRRNGYSIWSGAFVPLPYVLLAVVSLQSIDPPALSDSFVAKSSTGLLINAVLLSLVLTSSTLAMLGIYGRYEERRRRSHGVKSGPDPAGKKSEASTTRPGISIFLQIGGRIVDVGIPYVAALRLDSLAVQVLLWMKISSGLLPRSRQTFHRSRWQGWKSRFLNNSWTVACLGVFALDAIIHRSSSWLSCSAGVLVVLAFAFCCNPPNWVEALQSPSATSTSTVSAWNDDRLSFPESPKKTSSPLIVSTEETSLTLISAGFAAVTAGALYVCCDTIYITTKIVAIVIVVSFLAAWSFSRIHASAAPVSFATGLALAAGANTLISQEYPTFQRNAILGTLAYVALHLDATKAKAASDLSLSLANGKNSRRRNRAISAVTNVLLDSTERYSILHGILSDKDSRRIFYFMLLNLCFMLVQSTYGVLTGSLGLISDSIHMFFDCVALFVGLCAAVMSKWPPSLKYPYGYGKLDTLSGFGNGIFLLLISIEIVWEAVERLAEGSGVSRTKELLIVSVLGLLVNMVGIMAFEHGHAHGHSHGHSHGGHHHGHGAKSESHDVDSHPNSSPSPRAGQKSEQLKNHHHHHHGGGDNMHGIYLHILADTMGSGAVVVSTLCVRYTGWGGFDPLASCIIAILIFASAVPLVRSCGQKLLLSLPSDVEYTLRDILAGVSTIRGVAGYTVPKFWLDDIGKTSAHQHGPARHDHDHDHQHEHEHPHEHHCIDHHDRRHEKHSHEAEHSHSHPHSLDRDPVSNHSHCDKTQNADPLVLGVMHIIASPHADLEDVRTRVVDYLRGRNMDVVVQVERNGDFKCWCCAGKLA